MNINIQIVRHKDQRYNTVGDWAYDSNGDLQIKVSDTGDWRYNFLIARHELDEAILCRIAGVSGKQVDDYDFSHPDEIGGDSFSECIDAPYYTQHCDALAAEWELARKMGIDWVVYTKAVAELILSRG